MINDKLLLIIGLQFFLINPLSPELNPMCYLLALLAHDFLHISRIRVKSLTLRLLMSYIQGVSRLVDIAAGGDFPGQRDKKSSYKHVSDFGRLRS
jgi:hypothetical protein